METTIGFGGTFYTLWQVSSQIQYYTAPNGQHYPAYMKYQYSYIQNISKDIEKVNALYPGVSIDLELCGTKSFAIEKKEVDLTPEILKFGKYAGYDVREVVKIDLDYILYMIDRCGYNKAWDIAKKTPEYIEYLAVKKMAIDEKVASFKPLVSGKHKLSIKRNPDEAGVVSVSIVDGQTLELQFPNVKECYYNGITFYLPVFNDGKAKRLKGKEFEYNLQITETEINAESGYCYQVAKVLN